MSGGAGRFESKITSRPSKRIVGRKSFCGCAQLGDQRRRPKRAAGGQFAAIDVDTADAGPTAREKQCRDPEVVVLEVTGAEVTRSAVDTRPEVHRRLPPEVVVCVGAPRHPDVESAHSARTIAREEEQVAVPGERRRTLVERAVDHRAQVLGGPPRVAWDCARRDTQRSSPPNGPGRLEAK